MNDHILDATQYLLEGIAYAKAKTGIHKGQPIFHTEKEMKNITDEVNQEEEPKLIDV